MPGNTSSALPATDGAPEAPPADSAAPEPTVRITRRISRRRWLAALLVVVVVGAGAFVAAGGARIFANVPPEGAIWFGTSFDPVSYDVRERLTSVHREDTFVMVVRLPRPLAGPRLVIRGYLDGALARIAWTASTDEGALWGFNLGPTRLPGTWRYEIAEMGGAALASGEFVVVRE